MDVHKTCKQDAAKLRDIFRLVHFFLFFPANRIVFCIIPHTTELGMKDLTIHYPLLAYFSYLTIYRDRGDLAEFGNKTPADQRDIFRPKSLRKRLLDNKFVPC